jgi:membrane peptidoglycan carboxypeptidase
MSDVTRREGRCSICLLQRMKQVAYFTRGQYGIEAASRAYFGKSAKDLALHQAAGWLAEQ